MPPLTTIAEQTPNRGYPVPVPGNKLAFDVNRIRMALTALDGDVAALIVAIASAASLASPAFTGEPTAPTPVPGTNTNVLATTAFVMAAIAAMDTSDFAPLDSPTFTGTPGAPTADLTDSSTRIANTAFVKGALAELVGSAPGTLNTISELAAALQNNPDVISGILTSLGDKASQADLLLRLPILQPFVDVASTATLDLAGANSQNIRITGTTTITSFGAASAGTVKRLRFTGGLTLTHNAASLILPGAANITTSPNDSLVAVSLGGSNWIVLEYHFASRAAERAALGLGALATSGFGDIFGAYVDVTASRVANTSYLNNTGKHLIVCLQNSSNGNSGQISSDGSAWVWAAQGGNDQGLQIIVPPNWYYRCTYAGSLVLWLETRG